MITVKFLSGLERRLGQAENSFTYEGPAPISFRALLAEMKIQNLDKIKKPLFANCGGETFTIDKAFSNLTVHDGDTVVMFIINGGG